jgi:hypothetical protein
MVGDNCNPSYMGGRGRRIAVQVGPQGKNTRLCLKNKLKNKGPRDMTQVVECLPSKHKTVISNPIPPKAYEIHMHTHTYNGVLLS